MGVCPSLRDMVLVRWCGVTPPAAGSAGGSFGSCSSQKPERNRVLAHNNEFLSKRRVYSDPQAEQPTFLPSEERLRKQQPSGTTLKRAHGQKHISPNAAEEATGGGSECDPRQGTATALPGLPAPQPCPKQSLLAFALCWWVWRPCCYKQTLWGGSRVAVPFSSSSSVPDGSCNPPV